VHSERPGTRDVEALGAGNAIAGGPRRYKTHCVLDATTWMERDSSRLTWATEPGFEAMYVRVTLTFPLSEGTSDCWTQVKAEADRQSPWMIVVALCSILCIIVALADTFTDNPPSTSLV